MAYRDLRELLARPDIDAVLIATGDRWHALASVLAAKAGKDVYCEKPMSLTIAEGRAVADAMRICARVYQGGTQRRSVPKFRYAAEVARSGKLGRLQTVFAYTPGFVYDIGTLQSRPPEPEPPRSWSTGTCGWGRSRGVPTIRRTLPAWAAGATSPISAAAA